MKYLHSTHQLFKTRSETHFPNGTLSVFPILLIFTPLPLALECFCGDHLAVLRVAIWVS